VIKNFLNPEGHQNPISGSKITVILLKRWILLIGGASAGEGLPLQPAQQACLSCPSGEKKIPVFSPKTARNKFQFTYLIFGLV